MVYNNPVSYAVDITPEMFVELADEPSLVAIKESSENVRRITDLKNVCGDRYVLFCGVDDLVLESVLLGATGWVSGLVNAFPVENRLFWELATAGRWEEAREVYRWYTPLLHLDTHVKLVQYIKLAQQECGFGSEVVRAPRLPLDRRGARTNPGDHSPRHRDQARAVDHDRRSPTIDDVEFVASWIAAQLLIRRTVQRISVIDTHTGGEPTRVVIAGGPELGSGTMAERLAVFRDRHDTFRSAVVNEPRGSDVMVGAILLPPVDPACAAGVIFFNNVGYLGMCGHGTIGVAVALAHLGRIGPGSHRLETPVGAVTVTPRRPPNGDDRQRRELSPGQGREGGRAGAQDLCGRRRLGRQLVLPGARPRRNLERGQRRAADRRDLADSPGPDAHRESPAPAAPRSTTSSCSAAPRAGRR